MKAGLLRVGLGSVTVKSGENILWQVNTRLTLPT